MGDRSGGSFSLAAGEGSCCCWPGVNLPPSCRTVPPARNGPGVESPFLAPWFPFEWDFLYSFSHMQTPKMGHVNFRFSQWTLRQCARIWGCSGEYNREGSHLWWSLHAKGIPPPEAKVTCQVGCWFEEDLPLNIRITIFYKRKEAFGVALGHKWVQRVKSKGR